jgi:hypothetical protein
LLSELIPSWLFVPSFRPHPLPCRLASPCMAKFIYGWVMQVVK